MGNISKYIDENGRYTDEYIDKLVNKAKEDAESKKMSAGMNGAHHDGGHSAIMNEVNAFNSGRAGGIPNKWLKYARELDKELDPEYEEYLRLKAKFESESEGKPTNMGINVGHGLNYPPGKRSPKPKKPNVLDASVDETRDWFDSSSLLVNL